ncbi:MAG: M20/M25/M40 family metallo-hydrolase, partial [Spirochaetes bacterium]|nr:M20/M25/M40 family metallo-hydrolase [Spirochaetota bacterium]
MKKVLLGLCAAVVVLLVVCVVNTFRKSSMQLRDVPAATVSVDAGDVAAHLSGALQIKTVSTQEGSAIDRNEFLRFHEYLARTYPKAHRVLQRERVNDLSLLYTWKGSDPSLKPMLLMAHMDVVPADPSSLERWTHPPFSGAIADGFVWGRGSLDIKCCLIAIMDAVEYLAATGFTPRRTI